MRFDPDIVVRRKRALVLSSSARVARCLFVLRSEHRLAIEQAEDKDLWGGRSWNEAVDMTSESREGHLTHSTNAGSSVTPSSSAASLLPNGHSQLRPIDGEGLA